MLKMVLIRDIRECEREFGVISLPDQLESKVYVDHRHDENITFVYTGGLKEIHAPMYGNKGPLDLKAYAVLSKATEKKTTKKRIWRKPISCTEISPNWTYLSNDEWILVKGVLKPDYKEKLKNHALGNGVVLSNKLMEAVFGPIEEKLMDWYNRSKKEIDEATAKLWK